MMNTVVIEWIDEDRGLSFLAEVEYVIHHGMPDSREEPGEAASVEVSGLRSCDVLVMLDDDEPPLTDAPIEIPSDRLRRVLSLYSRVIEQRTEQAVEELLS
jgi:hypothetical protein